MKKRIHLKKRKNTKRKRIIKFLLFVLVFLLCINYLKKNIRFNIKDEYYLKYTLDEAYGKKNDYSFIINKILLLFNKDLNKPESLLTFNKIKNSSNNVDNNVKESNPKEDIYNEEDYLKITSYIENTNKMNIEEPIVYIYNTHQLETYSNEGLENYNMTPNVMMASYLLSDKLNKNGIKTISEDTNIRDFIDRLGLPSDELYGASRLLIEEAREKYPSLKFFIDLHRDSVNKDISTIEIDGKKYARVLFVLGTSTSNYEENEKVMYKISDMINEKYNKLSRGIYEIYIDDWPEAYNQDIDNNAILIELGAVDNTMSEVLNTLDVLSEVLSVYIKENL